MLIVSAGIPGQALVPGCQWRGTYNWKPVLPLCMGGHRGTGWRWFPKVDWSVQFGAVKRTCSGSRRSVLSVRADNDFFDSKPSQEAQSSVGKQGTGAGYHPLEEVSNHEKHRSRGDAGLMPPEIARTIAEMNHEAVIFASIVEGANAVIGTDLNYVVDEHGDFYFELNDGDGWVANLERQQTFTVLIGYGGIEDLSLAEVEVEDGGSAHNDLDDGSSDADSDDEGPLQLSSEQLEFWGHSFPGGGGGGGGDSDGNGVTPESMGSLGAWGGYESLQWVHPLDFAIKLATAAGMDYASEIDVITRRLCLVGTVHPVSAEEEEYVQDLFDDRFADMDDSDAEPSSDNSDEADDSDGDDGLGSKRWKQALLKAVRQEAKEAEEREHAVSRSADAGVENGAHDTTEDMMRGDGMESRGCNAMGGQVSADSREAPGRVADHAEDDAPQLQGLVNANEDSESDVCPPKANVYSTSHGADAVSQSGDVKGADGGRQRAQDELRMSQGWERSGVRGGIEGLGGDVAVSWVALNEDGNTAFSLDDLSAAELEGLKEQLGTFVGGEVEYFPGGGTLAGNGWVVGELGSDVGERTMSFFKLDIKKILLDTNSGVQTEVDRLDFEEARPDILVHSAGAMVERINNGGRKVLGGLINIVRREKGLEPEEASVVGIDRLGIDLRVLCGIELSTIRLAFRRPATCEEHAEQLVKELLNPRKSKRGNGPGSWQFKRKSRKR